MSKEWKQGNDGPTDDINVNSSSAPMRMAPWRQIHSFTRIRRLNCTGEYSGKLRLKNRPGSVEYGCAFFARAGWFLFDPFLRGCIALRHGIDDKPKPLDDSAVCGAARRHCARAVVLRRLVAETLSDRGLLAGSDHRGLLPDRLERPRPSLAHRS